jgi:hypothetical protein
MTRILNDFLMFACATAIVTGIVLAAATLLTESRRGLVSGVMRFSPD